MSSVIVVLIAERAPFRQPPSCPRGQVDAALRQEAYLNKNKRNEISPISVTMAKFSLRYTVNSSSSAQRAESYGDDFSLLRHLTQHFCSLQSSGWQPIKSPVNYREHDS